MTTTDKSLKNETEKSQGQKDGFCMACAALPAALAGTTAASQESESRKSRRFMFRFGMALAAFFIGFAIYRKCIKKCKECTA